MLAGIQTARPNDAAIKVLAGIQTARPNDAAVKVLVGIQTARPLLKCQSIAHGLVRDCMFYCYNVGST